MRLKFSQFLVALLMIGTLMLTGCSTGQSSSNASPTSTANPNAAETNNQTTTETKQVAETTTQATTPANTSESIPGMKDLPRLEGKATVVMTVKGAPITIEVDGTNAPITAGNFVDLVNKGVYDGLMFHRVIRDPQPFVAQGGDPQSKNTSVAVNRLGTGSYVDPKTNAIRYIPLEIKPQGEASPIYSKTFEMAGVTKPPELKHKQGAIAMARSQMPDSASSQFYFALADLAFLDGNYAVFGYVTQGFDLVNKIQQGDRIDSAKVTQGLENLK
ncbi:peptidyl-prolyl cis-trans isomerase cyclophilin type [Richelia sinica FACHB-800]|uniref:Peptidyl-prolyl cis-trans isomerase n=1 Tax=Richelia sinica FACHB-800 TaxID=1357546 RepID=A0A975T6L0_9NOST|nr:peptidylprolyl isomerase [Richelia sinica]MBD2664350.1 peptidylprolyl isomerase [Richelia sinica FACHB-800]QXE22412.1 peptidyl-prolyl cis-trans isomerase cyclophilin type [Richelia sinica FACHB-800]